MTFAEYMSLAALILSGISTATCVVVAVRAGNWRKTDSGRELLNKVQGHDLKLEAHSTRLENIDAVICVLPNKADLARLEGEVHGVKLIGERTERAVERLQAMMMDRT